MDSISTLSHRRPSPGALPAFSLPPPSEIPRTTESLSSETSPSPAHTSASLASQQNQGLQQYTYSTNMDRSATASASVSASASHSNSHSSPTPNANPNASSNPATAGHPSIATLSSNMSNLWNNNHSAPYQDPVVASSSSQSQQSPSFHTPNYQSQQSQPYEHYQNQSYHPQPNQNYHAQPYQQHQQSQQEQQHQPQQNQHYQNHNYQTQNYQQQQQQQQQQPLPPFSSHRASYGHSSMAFVSPRTSQPTLPSNHDSFTNTRASLSPFTTPPQHHALTAVPPFGHLQQYGSHDSLASAASHHSGLVPSSSQPSLPSNLTSSPESYAQSRPSSNSNYYTSTVQSSYTPYPSHPQHSPINSSSSNGSSATSREALAPMPADMSYAPYNTTSFGRLPGMGGPVLSNMHQPGGQMSMLNSVGHTHSQSYHRRFHGRHIMYGPTGRHPHSERPFRCDQCVQSFSRNHDLKRHKRIHLAVKPFPCEDCTKSFSRKDALKRHRLVKGCGQKNGRCNRR